MHSRSVLVSVIFEKNDEQGGEDCLSTDGFQIFGLSADVGQRIEKPADASSADALLSNIVLPKMLQILDTLRAFQCFDLIK